MYLKSLELSGFKSFARKTEILYNAPITAIVGPNGSGKSNIAEAFSFVLGEQSIKSMRGKRTEDLIWNGSSELARQNRALVTLSLDNRKRLLAMDADEISIERVIYRDAVSEYRINGAHCRLRDIVELLSGAHIGASGHHIISQGEADRILSANMRERREIIEDALGLKIFEWKREESEKKLQKTGENLKQVASLRRELAPHLAFLKKQVEKIEKTKALKGELRALYGDYLLSEHAYITGSKQWIAEREKEPKKELETLERELLTAKNILETERGKDARAKAIIAIEERLRALRTERETLSRELGRIEGEIAGRTRLLRQGDGEADAAMVPLSEVEGLARQIEAVSIDENEKDFGVLLHTLVRIKEAMRKFLLRHHNKISSPSRGVEREVAALSEKKKAMEEKLAFVHTAEKEAEREGHSLRLAIEQERDSSRGAEKNIFRIMARQNELRGILNGLRMRMHELEHIEADFKREQTEAILLFGRDVLDGEKHAALNSHEKVLEDRAKQEERRRSIERLKIRIEDAGGGSGAEITKEFEEASERDQFLARELADLEKSAENLKQVIAELSKKLNEEFRSGILKINHAFQKFFTILFGGGAASLRVVTEERKERWEVDEALLEAEHVSPPEEDKESGIDITVNLPRKKIRGLMMLSGGERALTSIALLFAMSQVKPPPFIILDETDAALDEANSKKYGDMVENLSRESQLILITHNRETMSRAGVIYGVTMDKSGVSKLLSIAFDEAAAVAK
ncbi:MAG: hypothetical protein A2W52_03045 [Candidatus Taylorbacteria bacterium RIFCSPHIGHO2_02_49_25]|uniref:RecF/RecN/SMC N-terminal domain-containing protein n=1 Tax=Candidatus Taylorbacteria bacterium RIFCSPHIGHO2_02_49_25 TaxID=1802305 RepID=A0A1G2MEB6_9BACT|nr:MAG: Chromosome partition protein smc [Parcubacteria group bacterium GW2011_GWF2_50_9]OHA19058.1 MAG: hypothetical protein A2759_02970 [Candidatus Taylorbacteria bacterium RIFCSPHIGHO2_01_FULL_49_60]OHA22228.1 MAG: hypothetical protein A2W52_03045 [Candidatus Taylorbacteria bacterium RIFCSPHIGHO2_02_49_25]OHA35173.1 MAG: hypothetical protein A3B27_01620 [Candidatus Taylorbacteria bacterium RIFCSPLOWO2_01_FULL_50_130]OHA36102.1 MAG: hypothetical protein A2W65_02020 [Candidatus Taylorbacteria 